MAKLDPTTPTVLDGDVRLFKRPNSKAWQATFKIDGRWVRVTTKCRQLSEAKAKARELYLQYKVRQKNGLPVVSKRFADVAAVCIAEMDKQLEAGAGKKSFRDYKIVLERYLIPYFGDQFVTSITYEKLQAFAKWRAEKMGKEPRASTLNTHNSALNRVFDEAVARGYMNRTHVPTLVNKGRDSKRRPDFRRDEYRKMVAHFTTWVKGGRDGKSRDMRYLLRDYVLILANTGIRHGTEAENLRWKHIHLFEEAGQKYLEMHVNGKTGGRDLICRANTINYLKRIQSRSPDIADMSFEELLKAQIDEPVFRLPDGTVSKNLRQTFRILMNDTGLLVCPRTGQDRTLYSLRHTYATFALLNDGMDIHTLAIQMGTSIAMLEKHYSHLTPRLRKDMLTGKRYEHSKDEHEVKFDRSSVAVGQSDLERSTDELEALPEDLPQEPSPDEQSETSISDADVGAAKQAFDLFDEAKLTETGLLAVLGSNIVANESIVQRALTAVGEGRLSEEALVRIMGR